MLWSVTQLVDGSPSRVAEVEAVDHEQAIYLAHKMIWKDWPDAGFTYRIAPAVPEAVTVTITGIRLSSDVPPPVPVEPPAEPPA